MATRTGLCAAMLGWLSACSATSTPGIRLDVSAELASPTSEPIESDLGYAIMLDSAWLTIARVEARACPVAWRRVYDVLVPSASAHGVSSPTVSAVPEVLSALATTPVALASLRPPAGEYCAFKLTLAPADDDAEGIDAASDMVGYTCRMQGSFVDPGGSRHPLDLGFTSRLEVDAPGLHLTLLEAGAVGRVAVRWDSRRWFDGLDLLAASNADLERSLADNLQASISVGVE